MTSKVDPRTEKIKQMTMFLDPVHLEWRMCAERVALWPDYGTGWVAAPLGVSDGLYANFTRYLFEVSLTKINIDLGIIYMYMISVKKTHLKLKPWGEDLYRDFIQMSQRLPNTIIILKSLPAL